MASRTAPDVSTASTFKAVTLKCIDASGDKFSVGWTAPSSITPANLEVFVAAYQAATQASVYEVQLADVWAGVDLASNADTGQRNSVADGVNILFASPGQSGLTVRVVAPQAATMIDDTDQPIVDSGPIDTLITASADVLPSGYTAKSAQFTERRERKNNPRVSA